MTTRQLAISKYWQAVFSVESALGSHHRRLLCDAISLYQYPDRIWRQRISAANPKPRSI